MTMSSADLTPTDLTVAPKGGPTAKGVATLVVGVCVVSVAVGVWAMLEGGVWWAWAAVGAGLVIDVLLVWSYQRVMGRACAAHHEANARALTDRFGVPVTVQDLEALVAPVGELTKKPAAVVPVAADPAWTVGVVEGPGDRPGKGTHLGVGGPAGS